ncbi:MAG: cation transporting ATPase C-terminal domain-containing protein [Solirubrobacteraceae bacterium]
MLYFFAATTLAGLSLAAAVTFAIGLLVANVPEGLLPTITLSLAGGVRRMAARRALVKRLTAVETLGSTDVICTGKTGTLTEGSMSVRHLWCAGAELEVASAIDEAATLDQEPGGELWYHAKGAPLELLERCTAIRDHDGEHPLTDADRAGVRAAFERYAARGPRVLGLAQRHVAHIEDGARALVESQLTFVGLAAFEDPPRHEVADAVARCRRAGIRIMVVTGDHALTAIAIAREVGIVDAEPTVISGTELDAIPEIVPFVIYALAGGAIPLPLTALQILAIDLGTDTVPALALGREPAKPGTMDRAPRPREAGMMGAAFAVRTSHTSLRQVGGLSNPHLLRGVAFALVFAAAIIYAPPLQSLFKTAALPAHNLLVLACFPPIVWGSDELWRWRARANAPRSEPRPGEPVGE